MKKLFGKFLIMLLSFILMATFASCGAFNKAAGGYEADILAPGGDLSDAEYGEAGGEYGNGQSVQKPKGEMTAGAWNDNDNYSLWGPLFEKGQTEEENGKFADFDMGFNTLSRVTAKVSCGDKPLRGARVGCYNEDGELEYSAVTDANGVAYMFTTAQTGTVKAEEYGDSAEFDGENRDVTLEICGDADCGIVKTIDIMFVVDVTGSMGDELKYLNTCLKDVVGGIAKLEEGLKVNLALLFYRDNEDKVPFSYFDFTDVTTKTGLEKQQRNISKQVADGGGNYPEAVDEALEMAVGKQWNTTATTKIIFHVLDAPSHEGKIYEQRYKNAVYSAAAKGIRICPIMCSGADTMTEYQIRQAAICTGGTFVFVTDDSGLGDSHRDPELPNVTVEYLRSLMVRLVKGYYTGTFDAPVYWKSEING